MSISVSEGEVSHDEELLETKQSGTGFVPLDIPSWGGPVVSSMETVCALALDVADSDPGSA